MAQQLIRIGVFYDGNFFSIISDYYMYHHPIGRRMSIKGLHEFVRKRVAHEEHVDPRRCQVVDVHYFRGRFTADETEEAGKLLSERRFDDVLIREGVVTHYLPIGHSRKEKGIDVSFALEAFELAIYKRFDVCVLVAGDGDFVPLARKLNSLGTRVMVLGWDFEYKDQHGVAQTTKTSQALLNEVTYPVLVSSIVDDKTQGDVVRDLFLPHRDAPEAPGQNGRTTATAGQRYEGVIENLIEREVEDKRFGFITPDGGGANIWFGEYGLEDVSFADLSRGDKVSYEIGGNWIGECAKRVRLVR